MHNMCNGLRKFNVSRAESTIWSGLTPFRGGLRTSGSGKTLRYYSWDNLHNEIEVFDRIGRHLGAMDPITGQMIKAAVLGRVLKL